MNAFILFLMSSNFSFLYKLLNNNNNDGFLQSDFHLKSSFDKTKYIFDQSIWECNGHFDHWFSNAKAFFVWHMEFVQGETLSFKFI